MATLPTILDNRDSTVLDALRQILPESSRLDVATGYFEVGALLALEGAWNELQKIRLLMGDETTRRTKSELIKSVQQIGTESIEREKELDDALPGLRGIRQAIIDGRIEPRVYPRAKFHAKAYLMEMKPPHLSNYGIVGSSNFTEPGLKRNVELNLLSTEQHQLQALREWFELRWSEGEVISDSVLGIIDPHIKERSPFEVYVKALYEYFYGKESPVTTWEQHGSIMYPMLDKLQQDGYRQAVKIADDWGGALICDGVGFGKTYVGLMLIERFLHERKRVAIIVPKSARESVWESRLRRFLRFTKGAGFSKQILLLNHTDLPRQSDEIREQIQNIKEEADVIIVDEAHHFRSRASQRGTILFDMLEPVERKKKVFFLTATPINNSLFDLLHLMEYFTRDDRQYFRKLGINDTRAYFVQKERAVEVKMGLDKPGGEQESLLPDFDVAEAERVLKDDKLFGTVVIQRSRSYAKRYFESLGEGKFAFPERQNPRVQAYKLAKVYGDLFERIRTSFDREEPFLELSLYNIEASRKDKEKIDSKIANREQQVLMLIRATMLKRMESSYKAFEASCEDLLRNMARFLRYYGEDRWDEWKRSHAQLWEKIEQHWRDRYVDEDEPSEVEEDDILPAPKDKVNSTEFFMDEVLRSVAKDMDELAGFLDFIHANITESRDDKLQALVALLNGDKELSSEKVIIFTQYRDTARYLYRELGKHVKGPIEELDSTSKKDREQVIKRFAPFYNCPDEQERAEYLKKPIRILVSTDVLSEGLNLQDGHLLINYDLHWNPVRLMQRIGRVDRRLDPALEKLLGREKCVVRFWNFLPPDELDSLLGLYQRVAGKVLRISKTLGIEGKKLLGREEDLDALRDYNAEYDGVMSFEDTLRLILEEIKTRYPDLASQLPDMPRRLFSGKSSPPSMAKGVFAAYRFPARTAAGGGESQSAVGEVRWYFKAFDRQTVEEGLEAIHSLIVCVPDTERIVRSPMSELRTQLKAIEQGCVAPALRDMQAIAGEKAILLCWMEVSG